MTRAESQANLAYPEDIIDATPLAAYPNWIDRNLPFREGFVKGYEQAEKDIIAIIESRISGIIGDAQPTPILRMELKELIKRIKDED